MYCVFESIKLKGKGFSTNLQEELNSGKESGSYYDFCKTHNVQDFRWIQSWGSKNAKKSIKFESNSIK